MLVINKNINNKINKNIVVVIYICINLLIPSYLLIRLSSIKLFEIKLGRNWEIIIVLSSINEYFINISKLIRLYKIAREAINTKTSFTPKTLKDRYKNKISGKYKVKKYKPNNSIKNKIKYLNQFGPLIFLKKVNINIYFTDVPTFGSCGSVVFTLIMFYS